MTSSHTDKYRLFFTIPCYSNDVFVITTHKNRNVLSSAYRPTQTHNDYSLIKFLTQDFYFSHVLTDIISAPLHLQRQKALPKSLVKLI